MSKIQWQDGDVLTSAYMQTFFGNNAGTGHLHTGTDTDGSAPKIDLTSHVTGQLPWANVQNLGAHEHDGLNQFTQIDLTTDITGILPAKNLNLNPFDFNKISGLHVQLTDNTGVWNQLTVRHGMCTDSTNTVIMSSLGTTPADRFTYVQRDFINTARTAATAWAPTTGCMPSALMAGFGARWYYVFLIGKTPTEGNITTDTTIGLDTSLTAVNLLADGLSYGYIYYRRVGAVLVTGTSGSFDAPRFYQSMNGENIWNTSKEDVSATTLSTTYAAQTLSVPPAVGDIIAKMFIKLTTGSAGATTGCWIYSQTSLTDGIKLTTVNNAGIVSDHLFATVDQFSSSTSTIQFKSVTGLSNTSPKLSIATIGWQDLRGQRSSN